MKEIIVTKKVNIGNGVFLNEGDKIEIIKDISLKESVMELGDKTIMDVMELMSISSDFIPSIESIYNRANGTNGVFNILYIFNKVSFSGEPFNEETINKYSEEAMDSLMNSIDESTNSFTQAMKSLDCYMYQISGHLENEPLFKALEELQETSKWKDIMREYDDYDDGYWGD